jgi:hypothetical protein
MVATVSHRVAFLQLLHSVHANYTVRKVLI